MSGVPFAQDHKAKKRLARHIVGGQKQEQAEEMGEACKDCGSKYCKGDCDDATGEVK